MCGINCIFDPFGRLPTKASLVHAMNDQMRYRGPDDEGTYVDDQVVLGMRRLSIIDVSGGHQPLYNEDRSLVLICNGEIYNYVELMHDLQARGHHFQTGSDTETILHLYEEKGESCLDELRGMFAFVLWDSRQHKLFAARDRVGIKPLYLAEQNGVLWLSSELKAIVSGAHISSTLRPLAVYQFLLYGYAIDQRHTVVEAVKRILPGEYLVADAAGIRRQQYWLPRFGGEGGIADRSDEEILATIETAVKLHLRSDVPVGILLSGGVDSSAVAAFAAGSGSNYTALCAGYAGAQAVDERNQAHATAAELGLKHRDVILDFSAYDHFFDKVTRLADEPVGDRAAMPQWALYERSRELGFKVVMTGIGGDEVFYGYEAWNRAANETRFMPAEQRTTWCGLDHNWGWPAEWAWMQSMLPAGMKVDAAQINTPLYALRDQAPWGPDAMASVVFGTYLVHNGCLLADKLGMGCSVEVRVPFLDHVLIDMVLGLPLARRFAVATTKPLLRQLLHGYVPEAVLTAPKRGFMPPIRHTEALVLRHCDEVLDGFLAGGLLDRQALALLVKQTRAVSWLNIGRIRRKLGIERPVDLFFRLISLERWYKSIFCT